MGRSPAYSRAISSIVSASGAKMLKVHSGLCLYRQAELILTDHTELRYLQDTISIKTENTQPKEIYSALNDRVFISSVSTLDI